MARDLQTVIDVQFMTGLIDGVVAPDISTLAVTVLSYDYDYKHKWNSGGQC
jgi:hypothetical protein